MNDDTQKLVQLAVDAVRGEVKKYSISEANETLREAVRTLAGGDTKFSYKKHRNGDYNQLYAFMEEVLKNTTAEGLQGDEVFNELVDFRNLSEGDSAEFVVNDKTVFSVDEVAAGVQSIRRQRISGASSVVVPTVVKGVKIWDHLSRVLSGRVDFVELIKACGDSMSQKVLEDIYTLWASATKVDLGGENFFPTAGAYDEDTLLGVVDHVSAAAGGKIPTLIATPKGARKLQSSIISNGAKEEFHTNGYAKTYWGSPIIITPQRHKIGSTEFVMNDDVISVVATDEKPIKVVYEGDPIISVGDPLSKPDLSQEYLYLDRYGMALVLAGGNSGIGIYDMSV